MTVDEYLAVLPADERETLERIRAVIRRTEPEAEEMISYGVPLYKLHRKHLIGFAAFKKHLSLFVMASNVFEQFDDELAEFDTARTKTTVRFTVDNPLPDDLVRRVVETRRAEVEELGG